MSFSAFDYAMMAQALRQAALGAAISPPNPSVGCVIVRDGIVVGVGHSQAAGGAHAEVMALRMAGELARGATAYVTLEPCSHFGRTPPCANALIAAGVHRVVAALRDPNPLVAGQGLARLAEHGVHVAHGLLAAQAREHHKGFLSRMLRSRPWLRVKLATSLDGRIALNNGQSQWITGAAARADVQRLRARSCAMLTGIGTVLADDPQLNVRDFTVTRQPQRVVLDSQLRIRPEAKILQNTGGKTHVLTLRDDSSLAKDGQVQLSQLPARDGRLDLTAVARYLGEQGFNEVTIEAGGQLAGAWLQSGLVDEMIVYQAASLIGNGQAMADFTLADLSAQLRPHVFECRMVGEDLRLTLRFTDPNCLSETEKSHD